MQTTKINKNKNYTGHSRIYLWHRFEQVESDIYLNGLSIKSKETSFNLLKKLVSLGEVTETLTEKDISDMNEIIEDLSQKFFQIKS